MEEGVREGRARQIEIDKFASVLRELKSVDSRIDTCQRRYVQCTSGVKEFKSPLSSLNSGNIIVDKCIIVFASLVLEVDILLYDARSKIFNSLLLYGEDAEGLLTNVGTGRAGIVEMMSNFLSPLYEISIFVERCYEVAANLLRQLYAFFNFTSSDFPNTKDRRLTRVWLCLGDILSILATLDEIVGLHPVLSVHWKVFVESVNVVQHNTAKFDLSVAMKAEKLRLMFSVIAQIQSRVIDGRMFENFCREDFGHEIIANHGFLDHFKRIITDTLTRWERLARDDMPDKQRLIVITCLTVFHYRLKSRSTPEVLDKKLTKTLWDTQKRILTFHIVGDILWTPLEFFIRNISEEALIKAGISRRPLDHLKTAQSNLFERQMGALPREMELVREAVAAWKTEIRQHSEASNQGDSNMNENETVSNDSSSSSSISSRCICILKGARLADRISRLVKYILNACLAEDRFLAKSNALHIFRLIEIINAISTTFNFHWLSVLEWTSHARTDYSARMLALLTTICKQFSISSQRNDPRVVDVVSALHDATLALHETPTRKRLVIVSIALEVANYQKVLRPAEVIRLDDLLSRLDSLANIGLLLSRVCDTSYLFWHRSLAGVYFESALFAPEWPIQDIKLFFDALDQCCTSVMLGAAKHCTPEGMRKLFQQDIFASFVEQFLTKLCTDVETDLRLTCHQRQEVTAVGVEQRLFPVDAGRRNTSSVQQRGSAEAHLLRLIQLLRPRATGIVGDDDGSLELRLGNRILNVRDYVSARLDATFYNLTTVALHDSETYTRMRALARTRFSLDTLSDAHLPFMKVDQGLDVVMIARNIHVFVKQYAYDLIEQMFIECFNNSRALNVVQVEQVVNSIRTHGVGILNTMVHVVYQFLKQSFQVFSQFLHDEHIKSLLIKEIRYYRDHIDQLNQTYPMERAEALNSQIRKLGISNDGKSFLDKFRELITQIGNAVGLIRMFCTGMLESREYAAPFIACVDPEELRRMGKATDNSPLRTQAADILADLIKSVHDTFDISDDYIEKLITVFGREFRNHEKYAHLRNFFILIPTLSVNFVEHIFACRNRLGRQRAVADADFTFVDDGFCFGIAYILRLLNQDFFFDSLNWFESVRAMYAADLGGAEAAVHTIQRARARDVSLAQALTLKLGRTRDLLHNYEHLEYTLTAALIFFRVKECEGGDGVNISKANDDGKTQMEEDEAEAYLEEF